MVYASSKTSSPGGSLKTKRSFPKYLYPELAFRDILIIQVLVTSSNSSFPTEVGPWSFCSLQAWQILSKFMLSSLSSCPHVVPPASNVSSLVLLKAFAHTLLPAWVSSPSELHKQRFFLPFKSQVGVPLHTTCHHLICAWIHLLLETTSISVFSCLWPYSPEGEPKLHKRWT